MSRKKISSNIYSHPYPPPPPPFPSLEAPAGPPSLAAKKNGCETPMCVEQLPPRKKQGKTLETLGELMKEMDLCVFFLAILTPPPRKTNSFSKCPFKNGWVLEDDFAFSFWMVFAIGWPLFRWRVNFLVIDFLVCRDSSITRCFWDSGWHVVLSSPSQVQKKSSGLGSWTINVDDEPLRSLPHVQFQGHVYI